MSMSAVLIVSLAAGVVLVVGGGLMMYMSNLVSNAYELKVQINSDMEERLKAISEDMDKKSKWIKQELVDELDKIKATLTQSNARTLQEMSDPLSRRIEALEQVLKKERTDWSKAIDDTRQGSTSLDAKLIQYRKDLRRIEEKLGLEPTSASGVTPPKPASPEQPANGTAAAAAAPAGESPKPAPSATQKVSSILPDLA